MVFTPETSTTGEQSTTTDSDSSGTSVVDSVVDTANRISTFLAPFVDILTVLVQALTAYTLVREVN